jgi:hypothetical protein
LHSIGTEVLVGLIVGIGSSFKELQTLPSSQETKENKSTLESGNQGTGFHKSALAHFIAPSRDITKLWQATSLQILLYFKFSLYLLKDPEKGAGPKRKGGRKGGREKGAGPALGITSDSIH